MVKKDFQKAEFLFPSQELINSIPKEFKIWNDLVFTQKSYTIGYIKTTISKDNYRSLVIATNEKELFGFVSEHILSTLKFQFANSRDINVENFHDSIFRRSQEYFRLDENELLDISKKVKNEAVSYQEKQKLELSLLKETEPIFKKLKI